MNSLDKKIYFFLIGAAKSGTISLDYYLSQHSNIFLPEEKDAWAFVDASPNTILKSNLGILYKNWKDEALIGLSQVQLLYFPEAAPRIHTYNPNAKILAVLRNPIDRAYSDYWYEKGIGWEDCVTFEEAVELEAKRKSGSFRERAQLTHLEHGHYHEQLMRYHSLFDKSQIYLCLSDDLANYPAGTVASIVRWLGLPPGKGQFDFLSTRNAAITHRSLSLQKALNVPHPLIRKLYHSLTPLDFRLFLHRTIIRPILRRNAKTFRYLSMNLNTRRRLAEYFAPHNEKLSQLIGRDPSHWR